MENYYFKQFSFFHFQFSIINQSSVGLDPRTNYKCRVQLFAPQYLGEKYVTNNH